MMNTNFRFLLLTLVVLGLDLTSKLWIETNVPYGGSSPLLPFLNIVHVHNTGAAFSMFREAPAWAFILLAVVVTLGIVGWLLRHRQGEALSAAGLCLIMGGAIGNVIDRLRLGHVTDFVDFFIGHWHFAAFNVADAAISIGAGLLILEMLLDWKRHQLPREG